MTSLGLFLLFTCSVNVHILHLLAPHLSHSQALSQSLTHPPSLGSSLPLHNSSPTPPISPPIYEMSTSKLLHDIITNMLLILPKVPSQLRCVCKCESCSLLIFNLQFIKMHLKVDSSAYCGFDYNYRGDQKLDVIGIELIAF